MTNAPVDEVAVCVGQLGQRCKEATTVLRNPDHVTIAVADAASAIEFFALLGFREATRRDDRWR